MSNKNTEPVNPVVETPVEDTHVVAEPSVPDQLDPDRFYTPEEMAAWIRAHRKTE